MKKYYWVSYMQASTSFAPTDEVTETHPFRFISDKNKGWFTPRYNLINWKEISQADYDFFNGLKEANG